LVFIPTVQYLMKQFQRMPDYIGTAEQVATKAVDGKVFATVNGDLVEVVKVWLPPTTRAHTRSPIQPPLWAFYPVPSLLCQPSFCPVVKVPSSTHTIQRPTCRAQT